MTVVDDAPRDAAALAGPATYATRVLQGSPVLVATVLAGVLHLLWWRLLATPGGDIAAQDAWAAFARAHPGSAYETPTEGGCFGATCKTVTLANLRVLVQAVRRAWGGGKRIWLTEWGYQTNPPDKFLGVSQR